MARLKRSNEHQTFAEIKLLFTERNEALQRFCLQNNVYFLGYTKQELEDRLSYHLREAEYDASFTLLAAIEAAFRLDCDYRLKNRLKDPRSKVLRRMSKELSRHISIDELFDALKEDHSIPNHTITLLKIYFKYRHWLAHGRYWHLQTGLSKLPTFADIYQLAQTINNLLYR